jgi:threonine/homoserine/homoserine lactone efflux protein
MPESVNRKMGSRHMTLESALTYFVAIFVFAITPGPGIFALLAKGMSQGVRACWPLAAGCGHDRE